MNLPITREISVQIKNKVHHVNQLIEPDLMMYIYTTFAQKKHPLHTTYLFKIFFSLLTLSTAFLHKASGPGKIYSGIKKDGPLYQKYRYNSTIKNHYRLIKFELKFML